MSDETDFEALFYIKKGITFPRKERMGSWGFPLKDPEIERSHSFKIENKEVLIGTTKICFPVKVYDPIIIPDKQYIGIVEYGEVPIES